MTNFEKYSEIIKENEPEDFFCLAAFLKVNNKNNFCDSGGCRSCVKKSVDWLSKEYKEPIKLKKWEYDLILNCAEICGYPDEDILKNHWSIKGMKDKGYFKGINDLNMTLKEIKDNHIIVEDNYEDFDQNCK